VPFDLKTDWATFKQRPVNEPDFTIDTAKLQAKADARKDNPLRWKELTFTLPSDIQPAMAEKVAKAAIGRGLAAMKKQGWDLHSDLRTYGPFPAVDPTTGYRLLGHKEYRLKAAFKFINTPKPKDIVKQSPDHRITAKEAAKALSLSLPLASR